MKALGTFLSTHFEILTLVFIFVFSALMLALFPMREEMARWIEGGAIVTVIARAMVGAKTTPPAETAVIAPGVPVLPDPKDKP